MAWHSPKTWSPGVLVTDDDLNQQIRDNLNALAGWIPTGFSGLHLRTHPDADKAADQVALLGAKWIVMNDGTRYEGLTLPLTASLDNSGAGGLDTGTRAASTWYGVYGIGKSSTRNVADFRLLLHREKNYKLDQSFTTIGTSGVLRNSGGTNEKVAQSIKTSVDGVVPVVDLLLLKLSGSAPVGNFWLTIEADASGSPSGTVLATSDTFNAAVVPVSGGQWIRFVFRQPPSLTASTTYWIVLQGDYTASATNNLLFAFSSSGTYANGNLQAYASGSWNDLPADDLLFKLYVVENDTSVADNLPAGYDQYCQLGWVYNGSADALARFVAHDRTVLASNIGAFANAGTSLTPSLQDLSAYLPPISLIAFLYGNNGTVSDATFFAGIPDGYAGFNTTYPGLAQRHYQHSATSNAFGPMDLIPTEFQAVYEWCDAGSYYGYCAGFMW